MIGDVEIENLKSIMDVRLSLSLALSLARARVLFSPPTQSPPIRATESHADTTRSQLWLDNQSTVSAVSSLYSRVLAAASGVRNAFFGQTRSRARLNAIASYDQSNELFMVRLRPSSPSP